MDVYLVRAASNAPAKVWTDEAVGTVVRKRF